MSRSLRTAAGQFLPTVAALTLVSSSAAQAQGGSFRTTDPVGDLLGTSTVQHDITSVTAFADERALRVFVEFDESLRPADSGAANSLFGFLDLDTDRDARTGVAAFDAQLGGTSGLGVDRWIGFGFTSISNSDVPVFDAANELVGVATILFGQDPHEISVEIPLELLGDDSDGEVDLSVSVANELEPTDFAPDQGRLTSLPNDEREFQDRFRVSGSWRSFSGETGQALWATSSAEAGVMWFFNPNNWELLVKVLDGCAINGHYWVFYSATTDVEFELVVEDLATGAVKTYRNELGQAADAVNDIEAFRGCESLL